jgi:D-alanine-D-alanine ligase
MGIKGLKPLNLSTYLPINLFTPKPYFYTMLHHPLPQNVFVWVLAPHLHTSDPNLEYYYDFTQSIEEYTRAFEVLQLPWQWQPVTVDNYKAIIDGVCHNSKEHTNIFFNLCDGDEVNGTPGISVVRYLAELKLIYTGAEESYYHLTTSKIIMKQAFEQADVATAAWAGITDADLIPADICTRLGTPVIVKPAVSGGSMGLGVKNVVTDDLALKNIVAEIHKGYHGWDLAFGGIVAEKFIAGPEYTSLIIGDYRQAGDAIIYPPVERVFHKALKEEEKFLSFDRLWETYDEENPIGEYENFYDYCPPENDAITNAINELSWQAYCAVEGTGYGRIDLRMDAATGKLYVLEVNAQCGLSEDENFTSIGAILRLGNRHFAGMVKEIITDALERNKH